MKIIPVLIQIIWFHQKLPEKVSEWWTQQLTPSKRTSWLIQHNDINSINQLLTYGAIVSNMVISGPVPNMHSWGLSSSLL